MTWVQWLLELLCRIYQEYGGDCADLGITPEQRITFLEGVYAMNGPPTFQDDDARKEFLSVLNELETCLDSTDNSLTQDENDRLQTLIAQLRSDIGATA